MADGVKLLNTIRANSSAVYQDRIPEATAENIHDVGDAILSFEAQANEFVNALINRIGSTLMLSRPRPMTPAPHRTLCLSAISPMFSPCSTP